jgi:hypothetical protein
MPKFIITQTDTYELEAETIEKAQEFWHNEILMGNSDTAEFLGGSTRYEPSEEGN